MPLQAHHFTASRKNRNCNLIRIARILAKIVYTSFELWYIRVQQVSGWIYKKVYTFLHFMVTPPWKKKGYTYMKKCTRFLSVILILAMVGTILPAQPFAVEVQTISDSDNSEDFSKFTQILPVLSSEKAECFVAMLCDFNANKSGDKEIIHADDMYKLMTGDYSKYDHSILALKMDLSVFSQYARTVIGSRVDGYSKNADKMAKLMIDMAMELAPNPNDSELTHGILNEISGHYKNLFKESLISYGAGIIGSKTGIYITETVIDDITEWVDLWNGSVGAINKAQEIANA